MLHAFRGTAGTQIPVYSSQQPPAYFRAHGFADLIVVFREDEPEMRARTLAALMAVLLFAWPVAAQEQRGSIEGVVKDSSGAVLPGVSVEARTNTGVVLTVTTDSEGVYRFPSLAPGSYEISATLAGF